MGRESATETLTMRVGGLFASAAMLMCSTAHAGDAAYGLVFAMTFKP